MEKYSNNKVIETILPNYKLFEIILPYTTNTITISRSVFEYDDSQNEKIFPFSVHDYIYLYSSISSSSFSTQITDISFTENNIIIEVSDTLDLNADYLYVSDNTNILVISDNLKTNDNYYPNGFNRSFYIDQFEVKEPIRLYKNQVYKFMIQTSYNFGIGQSVNSDLVINDSISNNSINNTASDNIITLFTNPDNFLDDSGNRLNEIYFLILIINLWVENSF